MIYCYQIVYTTFASGFCLINFKKSYIQFGNNKSSPAIIFIHTPCASDNNLLQFAGIPVFFSTAITFAIVNSFLCVTIHCFTDSTVLSSDPSSLIISSMLLYVCANTLSNVSKIVAAELYASTPTVTSGLPSTIIWFVKTNNT